MSVVNVDVEAQVTVPALHVTVLQRWERTLQLVPPAGRRDRLLLPSSRAKSLPGSSDFALEDLSSWRFGGKDQRSDWSPGGNGGVAGGNLL